MARVFALLTRPVGLHGLPFYILTRGRVLAGRLLLSGLVLAVAGKGLWLAGWYCSYLQSMAAVMAGCALIGSLLLEGVLRRTQYPLH